MKTIQKFWGVAGLGIATFFVPLLASAQIGAAQQPSRGGYTTPPQSSINSVQGVLNEVCAVFDILFYFLIALAVLFIVIAAYRYLTASGNPEKVKSATNTILYAAIAVAVALLAFAVPLVVANFLGANGNIGSCGGGSSSTGSYTGLE